MTNSIKWETYDKEPLTMKLYEKGLGLTGFSRFFFYFCGIISLLSMLWVIVISIGVFASTKENPTLPSYYPTISIFCICLSMMCINILLKFYKDKKNYEKKVDISEGRVKYMEFSTDKKTEWEEKLRKYNSVELRHYNYRGVQSWYIFLQHQDKSRRVILFAPEYKERNSSENEKREVLDSYAKLFNLPSNYLDLEASFKQAEEESKHKK